jgi:hypothetical protein
VFTRPAKTLRPPLAVPPRPGPAPRSSSHLPGLWVTRHQRGFTHVRPSGLPLARVPGWSGSASASSLSSAPRSYPRRTSGRGLALNTGQELRHRHRRPSNHVLTRNMPPRVARSPPSPPPKAPFHPLARLKPGSSGRGSKFGCHAGVSIHVPPTQLRRTIEYSSGTGSPMPGMSGTGAMSVTSGAVPGRVRPWPGSGGWCPHRLDGLGRAARLGSCGIPSAGSAWPVV